MSPFQTSLIRFQLFPSLQLTSVFALNVSVDRETVFHNNPFVGLQENAKGMNFTLLPHQPKKTVQKNARTHLTAHGSRIALLNLMNLFVICSLIVLPQMKLVKPASVVNEDVRWENKPQHQQHLQLQHHQLQVKLQEGACFGNKIS